MPEISRFFGIVIAMHCNDALPPTSTLLWLGRARSASGHDHLEGHCHRVLGLVVEWASSTGMSCWRTGRVRHASSRSCDCTAGVSMLRDVVEAGRRLPTPAQRWYTFCSCHLFECGSAELADAQASGVLPQDWRFSPLFPHQPSLNLSLPTFVSHAWQAAHARLLAEQREKASSRSVTKADHHSYRIRTGAPRSSLLLLAFALGPLRTVCASAVRVGNEGPVGCSG